MGNGLPSFTNSGYKRSSYEEIAKWISEFWKFLRTYWVFLGFHMSDIVKITERYDENAKSS